MIFSNFDVLTFETISCSVITLCAKLKTFLSNDKLLKNGNV